MVQETAREVPGPVPAAGVLGCLHDQGTTDIAQPPPANGLKHKNSQIAALSPTKCWTQPLNCGCARPSGRKIQQMEVIILGNVVMQETAWEVPAAVVAARGGGSKVWGPAAPTLPHPIRPPCPLFSCFALLAPRSVKRTFAVPLPQFCFL